MNKVKVDSKKIDVISDVVSKVVNLYEDDYMVEGAYIDCHVNDHELVGVDLHIVYIDYRFKLDDFSDSINSVCNIGVDFNIMKDAYWMYSGENLSNSPLMRGNIIFDKNGNLSEVKRLAEINGLTSLKEVSTEPPIQYQYRKVN